MTARSSSIWRRDGYLVLYVAEMEPGIPDGLVLERANEVSALLLTADKDFGELVFREGRLSSGGVTLIRLAGLSAERKAETVAKAFAQRGPEFAQTFGVISPGRIRVRRQP